MTKIISLDSNKCIGCNTCPSIDSETFELNQTTYKAAVKKQPTEITKIIQDAVDSCPVGAISITEQE